MTNSTKKYLTKNDIAWQQIFDDLHIIQQIKNTGRVIITSDQINEYRESRLMTKFDNKSNLPKIFQKHPEFDTYDLSILPITRRSYVIAPFETYCIFPKDVNAGEIKYLSFPEHIQSITPETISSESAAINCAYLSGMIDDFANDEQLLPTVSGRMGSQEFSFNINNLLTHRTMPIQVQKSQIEVDGCYEGLKTFSIIEAKNNSFIA